MKETSQDLDLKLGNASCWLESSAAIVKQVAIDLGDSESEIAANPERAAQMLWGAFHLMRQVENAVDSVHTNILHPQAA